MPCLNEAETLAGCIEKAQLGIQRSGARGEILVADNGSKDDSVLIAEKLGARVVQVKEKGYGNALRGGIQAASGKWIIMGDADESYDFSETDRFVKKFQENSCGSALHETMYQIKQTLSREVLVKGHGEDTCI
jgi:glycosyltransferase involved in cell wall biosynthesis